MSRSVKLKFPMYDSEDREVEVTVEYYAGSSAYYHVGLGCHLPGDPPDIDVVSVRAIDAGANVEEIEDDEEAIYEAAVETAREEGDDRAY